MNYKILNAHEKIVKHKLSTLNNTLYNHGQSYRTQQEKLKNTICKIYR